MMLKQNQQGPLNHWPEKGAQILVGDCKLPPRDGGWAGAGRGAVGGTGESRVCITKGVSPLSQLMLKVTALLCLFWNQIIEEGLGRRDAKTPQGLEFPQIPRPHSTWLLRSAAAACRRHSHLPLASLAPVGSLTSCLLPVDICLPTLLCSVPTETLRCVCRTGSSLAVQRCRFKHAGLVDLKEVPSLGLTKKGKGSLKREDRDDLGR